MCALPVSKLAAAADPLPPGEAEGQSRDGLQPPASGWLPGAPKRSSCWCLSVLGSGQARHAAESHSGAAGPGPVCQPVWPLAHRQDAVCRLPGREGGFLPGEPRSPWGLGTSPEAPGPAPPARGPQVSTLEEGVLTVSGLPPRLPCLTSSTAPALLFPSCLWSHFSSPLAGGRGGRLLPALGATAKPGPVEKVGKWWQRACAWERESPGELGGRRERVSRQDV